MESGCGRRIVSTAASCVAVPEFVDAWLSRVVVPLNLPLPPSPVPYVCTACQSSLLSVGVQVKARALSALDCFLFRYMAEFEDSMRQVRAQTEADNKVRHVHKSWGSWLVRLQPAKHTRKRHTDESTTDMCTKAGALVRLQPAKQHANYTLRTVEGLVIGDWTRASPR